MKIKKYEGRTEQEVIEKVKAELGMDALILNIKKTQPRGFFAFLRKPIVEVTAAYDEKFPDKSQGADPVTETKKAVNFAVGNEAPKPELKVVVPDLIDVAAAAESLGKDKKIVEQQEMIKNLERRLNSNEDLIAKMVTQLSISQSMTNISMRRYENNIIQTFYDTLVEQSVIPEVAIKILEDANAIDGDDKVDINLLTKVVYNTIIKVLGEPQPVVVKKVSERGENEGNAVFFLGPTGVGKTTTIAKLSSSFILNNDFKVGLMTADTYRVAAVEQLKTYGEILGIDVCVVYKAEDLRENLKKLLPTEDIVLIDTAGRSHKNEENVKELKQILDVAPDSRKFLVLSVATKYEDLMKIIEIYSSVTEFDLIFTKLDETSCLGSILNICCLTGKKMSYVAYGQNVPDDIEIVQSDKIAKALLGFGGGMF